MAETAPAACVMGFPVKHSCSPLIHGYWLKQYGIKGDYRREEIKPEDFPDLVTRLAEHGYVGGNVTMPHKDAAFRLSQPDERARAVGAANTLWLDNGALRATNTDVEGFIDALDEAAPGWDKRVEKAVVMGAGGAARAVVYGLVERGIPQVCVVNRTLSKAESLRERFGDSIAPLSWDKVHEALAGAGLLANATSLGMEGFEDLDIDLSALGDDAVVADIVYVPLETSLLKAARARGLRTSDGLAMLLHQARRGFQLWFGVRPHVTKELRALVETELKRK